MGGEDREVAIPILARKPLSITTPASSGLAKAEIGYSKSPNSVSTETKSEQSEVQDPKEKLEDSELKRDLIHIVFLLIISGTVVALNLLGMLSAIPGLRSLVSLKLFTIKEIQKLAKTLASYAKDHFVRTLTVQILLGTWVQTFMIPGATVLNMLAGNNFGMWMGLATTMFYNSLGSIFLYLISRSVGRRIVKRYLHDRVESFRTLFQGRTGKDGKVIGTMSLVIYLTSLRIFPFTPNWFLNVSMASLEIPLTVFIPSMVVGLLPYNYLAVSAGLILQDLPSVKTVNANASVLLIAVAAVGLTIPSLLARLRACLYKEAQGPSVDYYWKQVRKAHQHDEK